jgi:hypothetical protein
MSTAVEVAAALRLLSEDLVDLGRRQFEITKLTCARLLAAADQIEKVAELPPTLRLIADRMLPLAPRSRQETVLLSDPARREVANLLILTSERFGVSVEDILGRRRTQNLLHPRHCAIWLISHIAPALGWSLSDVGRFMDRDHTTILYSLKRMEMLMLEDHTLRAWLDHTASEAHTLTTIVGFADVEAL